MNDDSSIAPTLKFQNEEIALGERYGDSVSGVKGKIGGDYLAGGSGMILSHKTVTLYFYIRPLKDANCRIYFCMTVP